MSGKELTGEYRKEWDKIKEQMSMEYQTLWESEPDTKTRLDGGRSKEERSLDEKYRIIFNDIIRRAEAAGENG